VALRVAGDSTYGVAFPAVLLAFTVDDERLRIAELDAMRSREPGGAIADKKHMPAVLHHLHRQVDRMSYIADCAHATGAQLRPFHHSGVELDISFEIETGADPGVEKRLVLQLAYSGHCRDKGAIANYRPPCRQRPLDRSLAQRALGHRRRPGAAVDDQCRASHLRPRLDAGRVLQAWLRPGFAPLQGAAFRNPSVEWEEHPASRRRANGIAPLGKPALAGRAPPVLASPLAAARHQKIACRYVTLTLISHGAQC
jgi:hypothetical protein